MIKIRVFFLFLLLIIGKSFAQSKISTNTLFNKPYIDLDEWRENPVKHRYIHGGFKGTETRFSFYFPAKEQYQGRFFQYITPVPDNENLSQGATGESDKIGFSIASGAYFVETNGGGITDPAAGFGKDALIVAFKANEAAARYSRTKAAEIYGVHRTYGYCFGGSGGAYRTIGGLENTDAWDGAVPYVVGSPVAIPNVFTVRMHAMRILKDKFPQIVDAIEPGGSGDMYAGLTTEESEALKEVTQMGFPPKAWFAHKYMGIHAFPALYQGITMADGKYFEDFWKVSGYLGAKPTASLLRARVKQNSKIKMIITADEGSKMGLVPAPTAGEARGSADAAWKSIGGKEGSMPVAFQIEDILPDVDFLGGDLLIKTGASAGKKVFLSKISGDKIVLGSTDPKVLASIQIGDEVVVDNSNFLAAQTYHRHQVPSKEYTVWDQFRGTDGKPIYPQRPMQLGPLFTRAASGVLPSGKFKGKMILLESLWDSEAFPWQADWYRTKVKENLGENIDNNFRVWFTDHANHADFANPGDPTHLVSYLGVIQQALRDLSNWVEKGLAPPASTTYKIENGQVIVPAKASERNGIQATIEVKANGLESVNVNIGKSVNFIATIELPKNSGQIIAAAWDFEGKGTFDVVSQIKKTNATILTIKSKHTFLNKGTYFPTLKVTSQREGDTKTPFARIHNLGKVRVVVK